VMVVTCFSNHNPRTPVQFDLCRYGGERIFREQACLNFPSI
jgi:hypothetical protein